MSETKEGNAVDTPNQPESGTIAVQDQTDTTTSEDDRNVAREATQELESENDPCSDTQDARDSEDAEGSKDTSSEGSEDEHDAPELEPTNAKGRIKWASLAVYGLLPGLALLLAIAAGFLRWHDSSDRASQVSRAESVAAAKDSTVALLSYQAGTVEKDLHAAQDRLTGDFKQAYTQLTNDVVIPGSVEKHISAVATVPAAASVSATPNHAVAMLFVNQTVVIGTDAPTDSASVVRVSLDKVGDRWLISGFDPI